MAINESKEKFIANNQRSGMRKLKENQQRFKNTYTHIIGETQRAARKRHAVDIHVDGLLHPLASDEIKRVPHCLFGRQFVPLGRRARNIVLAGDWMSEKRNEMKKH